MSWLPLVSTILGAVIALSGSLLAGRYTARGQLSRDRETFRRTLYVDFATALDTAHFALRTAAQNTDPDQDRGVAAIAAVADSGLHRTREHLLMFAPAAVASAGESAFLSLIDVRRAVQAGADLQSPQYHAAYHSFAEKIWGLRMIVRQEIEEEILTPSSLGRADWSERGECPVCARPGK